MKTPKKYTINQRVSRIEKAIGEIYILLQAVNEKADNIAENKWSINKLMNNGVHIESVFISGIMLGFLYNEDQNIDTGDKEYIITITF